MAARIRWRTPPPTSIDERLWVADDGTAVFAALCPRTERAEVGLYRTRAGGADLATLAAAGDLALDVLHVPDDPEQAAVAAAAERVALAARRSPYSVITFHAGSTGAGVALSVVASGSAVIPFEVDVPASAVHFADSDSQPVGWHPFPELPTGFVTADAEGLGGVRGRAHVPPGSYGALVFGADVPAGAATFSLEVIGWLHDLPDEPTPVGFRAMTAARPLERPA
jgi:hypothetical protein